MKIGFYSAFEEQMEDRMFLDSNVRLGDDLLLPFIRLKEAAAHVGFQCFTADMAPLERFGAFVFCEVPEQGDVFLQKVKRLGVPLFLMILENHFVRKENAEVERYRDFDAVFTYNDDWVDGQRVFKINYAADLPFSIPDVEIQRDKLAVMICSNQQKDRKNLLYHRRRETIQWFEDHHPEDFDLYGFGWDNGTPAFQTKPLLQKIMREARLLHCFPRRMYKTWRGCVERKREVLGKYRFGFCYENTDKIPGYITEKMMDVMMAGCVPIYLGAENTSDHIPKRCFIDRKAFADHQALYDYLTQMSDVEYAAYTGAIRTFLSTKQSNAFSINVFVDTVLRVWTQKLKG